MYESCPMYMYEPKGGRCVYCVVPKSDRPPSQRTDLHECGMNYLMKINVLIILSKQSSFRKVQAHAGPCPRWWGDAWRRKERRTHLARRVRERYVFMDAYCGVMPSRMLYVRTTHV
jgi:hypothetical protein